MPLLVLLSKGLGIMSGVHSCIDIITYYVNYLKLPYIFVLVVLQTIEKTGALIKGHEKEIIIYLKENYCPTLENLPDCPDHLAQWYPNLLQVP